VTLTNRLTVFFLTALAVVLVAFSITLYALARTHLMQQVDERAASNLDTLVAAVEVEPDGLEWDRRERTLWPAKRDEPTVWAVFDFRGREVDGDPDHVRLLQGYSAATDGVPAPRVKASWDGGRWWVYRRTHAHPLSNIVDRRTRPDEVRNPGDERYRTLVFVIAAPLDATYSTLQTLAWCLVGVSVVVWISAACGGRWVCRRALAPLTNMSGAAKEINADDLEMRLPVPVTRDELADLAAAFNDLLARLQESFERQRRFTGEASHQLRTPLTAMLGQMEVALRRDRDPDEYRRVLASAVAQAGRLRQIVEALLFLARADADSQLPGLEVVDLVGWLPNHVAESWSGHPRYGDLRIERAEKVMLLVHTQPTLLAQTIDNLIDNAFKDRPINNFPVLVGGARMWHQPGRNPEGRNPCQPHSPIRVKSRHPCVLCTSRCVRMTVVVTPLSKPTNWDTVATNTSPLYSVVTRKPSDTVASTSANSPANSPPSRPTSESAKKGGTQASRRDHPRTHTRTPRGSGEPHRWRPHA